MEGGVDRAIGGVTDFVKATADAGALTKTPFPRLRAPADREDAEDRARPRAGRRQNISRELNLGVSGIMFVETESADEVRAGIAAMRFKSKGGTRPDDVGMAPAYWGMTEAAVQAEGRPLAAQSRRRAGQLDDRREQGRARARPRDRAGQGHRRAVAGRRHAARRVLDDQRRRRARRSIRPAGRTRFSTVLAACKEFHVPCGFPGARRPTSSCA